MGAQNHRFFENEETENCEGQNIKANIDNIEPYVQELYCTSSNVPSPAIVDDISKELTNLSIQKWNILLEQVALSEAQHIVHSHKDKGGVFLQIFVQKKECNWKQLIDIFEEMGLSHAASVLDSWYLDFRNDSTEKLC